MNWMICSVHFLQLMFGISISVSNGSVTGPAASALPVDVGSFPASCDVAPVEVTSGQNVTLTLTVSKSGYTSGTITIPPGQTLWATVDWDCRLDDSTWVFAYAQFRAYAPQNIRLNEPLELDSRATVRIFRSAAASTTPVLALPVTMTGTIIWGP